MTTNEMKTILYDKLCDECCYFTKSDISIRKHGQEYRITIKDYECIPFKMFFEYDDYFGYIVYIDTENESIAFVDSKTNYDIKTALIELGYYIGTRF